MLKRKTVFTKFLVLAVVVCVMATSFSMQAMAAYSFTTSDVTRCFNAFMNNYYQNAGDFKYSLTDSTTVHFWEAAYIRQMMTDYYLATGLNKDKISETYYRYESTHCADRFGNTKCWIGNDSDWNDDYSWQAQFTMSAYEATGDQYMLDQAKWHFDYFYSNNVDNTYGGGMWRNRDYRSQKDVPTNGWGIVAARLAKYYPNNIVHNNLTGADTTYLQCAQDTYNWIKSSFMRSDGGIQNSFSGGTYWDDNLYTYNAGIFIELAAYLYDLTKNTSYLTDACKAADFAKAHFTTGTNQIVVYEDDVGGGGLYRPDPTGSYEIVFKGIMMRGIYKLIMLGGQTQYADWLSNNAQSSYNNRTNDLPSGKWDGTVSNNRATGVASGLSLMTYSLLASSGTLKIDTNATYKLVNRNSGKDMDVYQGSKTDGGQVIQWTDNGGSNQKWQFVDAGNGYYKIKNVNSGKILDVYQGSSTDGTQAIQWTDNNGNNQKWFLIDVGNGNFKIRNVNSGKIMDVYQGSSTDGTQVIQWTDNGGYNQQWKLVKTN